MTSDKIKSDLRMRIGNLSDTIRHSVLDTEKLETRRDCFQAFLKWIETEERKEKRNEEL
jgi:hypothetical protein